MNKLIVQKNVIKICQLIKNARKRRNKEQRTVGTNKKQIVKQQT